MHSWVTAYKRFLFWNIWWPNHYKWRLFEDMYHMRSREHGLLWENNRAWKIIDTKSEVSEVFWMPEEDTVSVFLESLTFGAHLWKFVRTVCESCVCSSYLFFLSDIDFSTQRVHHWQLPFVKFRKRIWWEYLKAFNFIS